MICFWTEVTKNATLNATVGYLRGVGGVLTYGFVYGAGSGEA